MHESEMKGSEMGPFKYGNDVLMLLLHWAQHVPK